MEIKFKVKRVKNFDSDRSNSETCDNNNAYSGDIAERPKKVYEELATADAVEPMQPVQPVQPAEPIPPVQEEPAIEQSVIEEEVLTDVVAEEPAEEAITEMSIQEEPVIEEEPVETPAVEEIPAEQPVTEELIPAEEPMEEPIEEPAIVEENLTKEQKVEKFSKQIADIKNQLAKDIVGMDDVVDNVIIAIIAGGNVLLEGVPGVGKTRLVRSLSKTLELPFARIQFTPDLMPSDVTGTNVIEKDAKGNMDIVFQKGPIFANLILADEINRATPKTQSAMLEVMQEHKVTIAKTTYKMSEPFFVLATQNPIEQDGTYPLPEAQMDRFMFKLLVGFPSAEELAGIVSMTQVTMDETAASVVNGAAILEMRELAKTVPVAADVLQYAVNLVAYTHPETPKTSLTAEKYLKYGASPRAAQALITCAKVRALMEGRYNVSFKDIDALAYPVLRHRIKINYNAISEKLTVDDVIKLLIAENKKLSK